ncbi:MAG: hypothetical protein LRS46_00100, partial [Desulfurococcales archaeon]|nr:hypothetical protein [Desulfurococcales archaeon]
LVFAGGWWSPSAWLHALAAVEAGYMMVFTPAPGGGGGVEYALISFLGPRLALYWRLSYLIAALSPLILVYTAYTRFKRYVGEYGAPEECEEPPGSPGSPGPLQGGSAS